ncbi:unnamed protein product [Brassicogethes aeneus]|uniref:Ubiquitin thioesterase OTU n=1 Tax=Brassicogethes aeneus TaxID=1431903 RepID=A0A9P0BBB6_BRAAE|nr:unnamed protein product [Brassicogethes aeneus]
MCEEKSKLSQSRIVDISDELENNEAHINNEESPVIIQYSTESNQCLEEIKLLVHKVPKEESAIQSLMFILNVSRTPDVIDYIRNIIARMIDEDGKSYANKLSKMTLEEYRLWILQPNSPIAELELEILADHYGIELCVLDTAANTIRKFGGNESFTLRAFLKFDGDQYFPVYAGSFNGENVPTIFETSNGEMVYMKVRREVLRKFLEPLCAAYLTHCPQGRLKATLALICAPDARTSFTEADSHVKP